MILSLSRSLVLSLILFLFFFPKNPNEETAELAGLGTRAYRCRGEHQKISRAPRTLAASGEKRKTTMERFKKQKKKGKGGEKKRKKKRERIKTALAEALRLSSAPNNGFGIRKTVQRKDVQRGRMRDTTIAQKLPRGAQDFVGDDGTRTTAATTFARSRVRSRGSHSYVMLETFF